MANWFITGVSTGLGRALAQAAITQGDTVVGTVRSQADIDTFAAIEPTLAHALLMDVTDEASVKAAVKRPRS